jgi:hypothetical protein
MEKILLHDVLALTLILTLILALTLILTQTLTVTLTLGMCAAKDIFFLQMGKILIYDVLTMKAMQKQLLNIRRG